MAVKRGLGKGIDSIITDKLEVKEDENVSRETLMNITKIEPNQSQPRKIFNEDALQELADSIKQHGLIQPIIVRPVGSRYEIIAGERRWRASQLAGKREIPVIIKEYNEDEIFEIALIENIQRENLNPIEEARAYYKLMNDFNMKQDVVAAKVGKDRTTIANATRLLLLDERVQEMVIDDRLSSSHARTLITIEDKELQYQIAEKIFDEKLSVREAEKLAKKVKNGYVLNFEKPVKKPEFKIGSDSILYRAFEDNIREIVGTKVEIQEKGKNKGKIIIDFENNDDFERIMDILRKGKVE